MSVTNQGKTAVIYGGGKIGRGFIAQLFCMSGYKTVFIDIDSALVGLFNRDGQYPIFVAEGAEYKQVNIDNFSAIDCRDSAAVADAIASAAVMSTAVGANNLRDIAGNVAGGIKKRLEKGGKPLNILICENMIDADKYFNSLLTDALKSDEKAFDYFKTSVGVVQASIGRTAPIPPKDVTDRYPLAICVDSYCLLPVDAAALKGEIPEIVNLKPFTPFAFYIQRKLYMHNMSHALIAYLGSEKGYKTVCEAVADKEIRYTALCALLQSARALSREHGAPLDELIDYAFDLLSRFDSQLLTDTLARVGRDTARKLSPTDRLAGAYKLCRKQGLNADAIMCGIRAAFEFTAEGDDSSAAVNSYYLENGLQKAISRYCGIEE